MRRLSTGTILSLLISAMGLLIVAVSASPLQEAFLRDRKARQVADLSAVARELFVSLASARMERGSFAAALAAPDPIPAAAEPRLFGNRRIAEEGYAKANALYAALALPGLDPLLRTYRGAHDAFVEQRVRADADIRKPKADRQPGIAAATEEKASAWFGATLALADAADAALILSDPVVDHYVGLKRAAWNMRQAVGSEMVRISRAAAAHVGWQPAEAMAAAEDHGQAMLAWAELQFAGQRADAPPSLKAALARIRQEYFGFLDREQTAYVAKLSVGEPIGISGAEFQTRNPPAMTVIVEAGQAILDLLVEHANAQRGRATQALLLNGAMLLAAVAISAAGLLIARNRIARPIAAMTAAMRRLAARDLDAHIPGKDRVDDIGAMAQAVRAFKDSMVLADRLAGEQAAEQAQKQRRAERLEALVKGFEAQAAELANQFSHEAAALEATAGTMAATASRAGTQARTAADAAGLAHASIETVAAAAEELSASVREVSQQVAASSGISNKAVADARRTDRIVRDLAAGAAKIGDVVSLIADIAGRTNLLALNATIEAARAGDAGKGFAVVASEVKSLATQTARATGEIGAQIQQVQTATQEAVTAISAIAATIAEIGGIAASIAASVEEQGNATGEIARSVQQTAGAAREVTDNIGGVSAASNETGAAAASVLQAAAHLSGQAGALSARVRDFVAGVRAA